MMTSAEFDVWVEEWTRFEPFDMAAHEAAIAAMMAEWGDIQPFTDEELAANEAALDVIMAELLA
jgi:hypothetical protein